MEHQSRPLAAAAWMLGTLASFSAMAVAARYATLDLDTFEIMLYRSLIGFAVLCLMLTAAGRWQAVGTARLGLHFLRNLFHFGGQNLWLLAVSLIPLAQVFALEFTVPIWIALAAPLVLGERLTRFRLGSALVGFVGILIVTRPDTAVLGLGHLAALAAAVCFAGSALSTKLLTRDTTTACILFWLTLMQAGMGLAFAGYDGEIALPGRAALLPVAVIGLTGLSAHYCLTNALARAPASVVMPVDFLRLPLIAVVGMLVFGEPLEAMVFLGAAVIFGAAYANVLAETRRLRSRA
ncbi:MAG: EamA family transporter [Alphaproteobacteria bacterium HGW-Alphaproteobacteria-2]|nr:MAG: EamA family transporter [Alphaproteobacteria bacterium HGW-Alphaproteobacteria-2]